MTPDSLPVIAAHVGDAALLVEEFVGHLEDREHQSALRAPSHVPAADLAPDELTRPDFEPCGRPFLVDELALDPPSLLVMHVLMVGQHGADTKTQQRGDEPGLAVE